MLAPLAVQHGGLHSPGPVHRVHVQVCSGLMNLHPSVPTFNLTRCDSQVIFRRQAGLPNAWPPQVPGRQCHAEVGLAAKNAVGCDMVRAYLEELQLLGRSCIPDPADAVGRSGIRVQIRP